MMKAVEASDPEVKVLRILTTDATTPREAVGEVGRRVVDTMSRRVVDTMSRRVADTMVVVLTEVISITEHPTMAEEFPLIIVEEGVDMSGADIEPQNNFITARRE